MADFTTNKQRKDLAILSKLGVNVDLSNVFNWNVKEIFIYLTAEYKTELNVSLEPERIILSAVIIWENIQFLTTGSMFRHLPGIYCEFGGF